MRRNVEFTHTSWKSSNDFCGVETFNKLMICKRGEKMERISTTVVTRNVKELKRGTVGGSWRRPRWRTLLSQRRRQARKWGGTKEKGISVETEEKGTGCGTVDYIGALKCSLFRSPACSLHFRRHWNLVTTFAVARLHFVSQGFIRYPK